jgi:hypothetical protein
MSFSAKLRADVIKKWREEGFLCDVKGLSDSSIIRLVESESSALLNSISLEDEIAYFENRVNGARELIHKIRPMQQLITMMTLRIIKKHCL